MVQASISSQGGRAAVPKIGAFGHEPGRPPSITVHPGRSWEPQQSFCFSAEALGLQVRENWVWIWVGCMRQRGIAALLRESWNFWP